MPKEARIRMTNEMTIAVSIAVVRAATFLRYQVSRHLWQRNSGRPRTNPKLGTTEFVIAYLGYVNRPCNTFS